MTTPVLSDSRRDPFNGNAIAWRDIDEPKTVQEFDETPGIYGIYLTDQPKPDFPITITGFAEIVSGAPNPGEFLVDYQGRKVRFNMADNGTVLPNVVYKGKGSPNSVRHLPGKYMQNKGDILGHTGVDLIAVPVGADGKVLKADSSTPSGLTWGEGSGGAGGINDITNPDAEANTNDWNTYADAAGTSPVDGTGGSPASTWTRSTSNPLRGAASFLLTKSAANRQGEGVSTDFTIARADRGEVHRISFDMEIDSGTYADGDVTVWILDVTNNRLIQPSGSTILNTGVPVQKILEFQTSIDSFSYRLIFHISTTSALAYALKFDTILVGPESKVYGPPVTDWQSFPATISNLGSATSNLEWMQMGENYLIRGTIVCGTPSGAGPAKMSLPNGASCRPKDTTAFEEAFGFFVRELTGSGASFTANANTTGALVYNGTPTELEFCFQVSASNKFSSQNANTYLNAGEVISIPLLVVPIVGKSSSVLVSSDTDTRIVAAAYYNSANCGISSTQPANFDTMIHDTHGAVTKSAAGTGTWFFTTPVPGKYMIHGHLSGGTSFQIQLHKNGSLLDAWIGYMDSGTGEGSFFTTIDLVAGDTIDIRTHASTTLNGGARTADHSSIYINRMSGPSQIAASESVRAKYYVSSNYAFSADNAINFDTKVYDSHNCITPGTGGTWKATAPISGEYEIEGFIKISTAVANWIELLKSGSIVEGGMGITSNDGRGTFFTRVYLLAGESVAISMPTGYTALGGALSSTTCSYVCFRRTGN